MSNNNSNNNSSIKDTQKLIIHPSFRDVVNEIRKINVTITEKPKQEKFDFVRSLYPPNGKLSIVDNLSIIKLNASNGHQLSQEYDFTGYDESKLNYKALEGTAVFTVHSLILSSNEDYLPVSYLSFYFYTRSMELINKHPKLSYSENPESESNFNYVIDRSQFLNEWTFEGTICFIDGPLIGGNMTSYTLKLVEDLHKRSIIPVFIVKNSESNLVTENIDEFKKKYNSDMHWAYNFLKPGERTSFFRYQDELVSKNAKIFCYLKAFDLSPQRVEFHTETFNKYYDKLDKIMDLIFYLFLAHGDSHNPQIRPIAIAEKFAREILKLSDSYNLIKTTGLIPTMNQERFGG